MDANDKNAFWKRYYEIMYGADLPTDVGEYKEEFLNRFDRAVERAPANALTPAHHLLRWARVKPAGSMRVVSVRTVGTKPFLTAADLVMLREMRIGIGARLQ
jgi:hypothetical protein